MSDVAENPDLPDDILPESEGYFQSDQSTEGAIYKGELDRRMHEQAMLRALSIENGDNAAAFLRSSFGQYLLGQADLEAMQAKEALSNVDPLDTKEIVQLQIVAKRAELLEAWVANAIENGNAEYAEYLQEHNED